MNSPANIYILQTQLLSISVTRPFPLLYTKGMATYYKNIYMCVYMYMYVHTSCFSLVVLVVSEFF